MALTGERLLRVDQVAERLNCSVRHIYNMLDREDVEATNIGCGHKGIRIFETSLMQFIEKRKLGVKRANGRTPGFTG